MARKTRKKTNETEFEVTTKDTGAGAGASAPVTTTKVKAGSVDQAIDQATRGNQATQDAEEVVVRKAKPTFGGQQPTQSQGVVPESTKVLSNKAITEGVEYPYSVSLPNQFRKLLEENSLEFTDVGSTVMLRFENKTQLTKGLKTLRESESDKAKIVLGGISRSLK